MFVFYSVRKIIGYTACPIVSQTAYIFIYFETMIKKIKMKSKEETISAILNNFRDSFFLCVNKVKEKFFFINYL